MTQGYLQIALFCAVIFATVPLLGGYMARILRAERLPLVPALPEQDWKAYAKSLVVFSLL